MKKKVVVYGLGRMYGKLKYLIEERYEIVGYADKYLTDDGGNIWRPEELKNKSFDYILVTPCGKAAIISELIQLGISQEKIVPYYGENQFIKIEDNKITVSADSIIVSDKQYQLELRTFSDDAVFQEVFIQREYDIHMPGEYAVLDIGMNVGITSVFFAIDESVKSVYGFEPFKPTYDRAVYNIENCSGKNKIQTFPIGLGSRNAEILVDYDENKSENMSLVWENTGNRKEKVVIRDAAELLGSIMEKERGYGRKILCKMDCEGSEFDIFESLERRGLISGADIYFIEWHYQDDNRITDYLARYGYTFMKSYEYGAFGKIIAWK